MVLSGEASPMALFPTAAQSAASRANGALSRGPVTPEGKAGSAANAPAARHGLRGTGPFRLLADEDGTAFQAVLDDLLARHAPVGAAERHCVEQLAHACWRERRLAALDDPARLAGTPEPEETPPLSLDTIARYRARLARDRREALVELGRLKALRPRRPHTLPSPTPAKLRWLPHPMEAPSAGDTPEPDAPPAPAATPPNRAARRRLEALARRAAVLSAASPPVSPAPPAPARPGSAPAPAF